MQKHSANPRSARALHGYWLGLEGAPTECWEWQGGRLPSGYGRVRVLLSGGRWAIVYAHRLAYLFVVDDIPEGIVIRHSCDNPPCCNGAHLLSGTQADNIADREARGRGGGVLLRGEGHPRAKLTWEVVKEIREEYAAGGITQAALAARYGVSAGTVGNVLRHRAWKEEDAA